MEKYKQFQITKQVIFHQTSCILKEPGPSEVQTTVSTPGRGIFTRNIGQK